ncbi:hypothetical protein C8Q69DRAFT_454692 [Paecilomyces variotii]|uniref:Uncharacterized protein n=1 Tax=Byssochlamys spectabilis TaxID=264951 RepID=A0A443I8E3_BYSSP|nr:hypothetical protein C8Q69DRAFT_454692 [Paecilomyces variotii]RWR00381.1 hypothetical protein C8Q69DRAFT_454692 [Paecilomyces variotii]
MSIAGLGAYIKRMSYKERGQRDRQFEIGSSRKVALALSGWKIKQLDKAPSSSTWTHKIKYGDPKRTNSRSLHPNLFEHQFGCPGEPTPSEDLSRTQEQGCIPPAEFQMEKARRQISNMSFPVLYLLVSSLIVIVAYIVPPAGHFCPPPRMRLTPRNTRCGRGIFCRLLH